MNLCGTEGRSLEFVTLEFMNVSAYVAKDLANVIKLRTLGGGDYPRLSMKNQYNQREYRNHYREKRQDRRESRCDDRSEGQSNVGC